MSRPASESALKRLLLSRRKRIDELDARLVRILVSRFLVARSLSGLKKTARDRAREKVVLLRVRRLVARKDLGSAAQAVYREIMRQCLRLQSKRC
jgi:chorismate mutase